ncbi:TonB-dependent siderophore receptor [Methylophilus methylotrophus]|uniref:TonB-dependent siderophore receptor n=1 Tax=Methylophilus methylotrophus TaxID=17 RepID=UPI000F5A231C|nr:TonB-dependent receptor [Methylophilus methylotrophus]
MLFTHSNLLSLKPGKKRRLHLMVAASLVLTQSWHTPLIAAENTVAETTKKSYNISAGPLGAALSAYAAQAGVLLSFDPQLTQNKQTTGLNGAYSLHQGFDVLLQGSGLSVIQIESNSFLLKKTVRQSEENISVLPEVKVTDKFIIDEPDQQFLQKESSTASRIPLDIKESPVSVTVIPKKIMDQQAVRVLADVAKNIASINQESFNAGRQAAFRSRGFLLDDETGYFVDGQPLYGLLDQPVELLERVEFLRGPASIQYGRAQPGGVANLIRKRPTQERFTSFKVTKGNYDYDHMQLDAGGRVPDYEHIGYRINVARERSDSFRDNVYLDRDVLGLVLDAQVTDDLKVTLLADYVNRDTPWDNGQFFYRGAVNDVPRSRYFELPWGSQSSVNTTLGYEVDWKLNDQWKLKHQYTYQDYFIDRHQSNKSAPNVVTGNFNVTEQRSTQDVDARSYIFDLIGDNTLWGMRHRTVFGYQRVDLERTIHSQVGNGNVYASNIFNPTTFVRRPLAMSALPTQQNNNLFQGIYAEDFIGLTSKLNLMIGGRYDRFSQGSKFPATGAASDTVRNSDFTPRAGLIYTPFEPVTLYASYSRAFNPNGRVGPTFANAGQVLDPQTGKQYEAGIKTMWLDNKLAINAAVYELTRGNLTFTDVAANTVTLVGEVQSKGFELEAIGEVADGWNIMASYAYLDSEIKEGTNKGNALNQAPSNAFKVWTSYDFTSGPFRNLSIYGGAFSQSEVFGDPANTFKLSGYTRYDIGASYKHNLGNHKAIWRFNAENITDKVYYFGNGAQSIFPGMPANARVSLEVLF